mgnify:CR=1 FL=1
MKRLFCIKDPKGKFILTTANPIRRNCVCDFSDSLSTNWEQLLKDGYRCVPMKIVQEKKRKNNFGIDKN